LSAHNGDSASLPESWVQSTEKAQALPSADHDLLATRMRLLAGSDCFRFPPLKILLAHNCSADAARIRGVARFSIDGSRHGFDDSIGYRFSGP
jgi:hypothetical protein